MSRPIVGIIAHEHLVARPWGELPVTGAPTDYAHVAALGGARPVLLPGHAAVDLLDAVDAIVLTGGGDLDPSLYGGDPSRARDVRLERDQCELSLVRAAARARIPTLGICRGMQVLAVAFGGILTADLGDTHIRPGAGHLMRTAPGSLTAALLGTEASVTSLHHQAVADPGPHWSTSAWTDDGVIEAIEWTGETSWPALGVQWHPEHNDPTGSALFTWLAGTTRPHRQSPPGDGRSVLEDDALKDLHPH